MLIQSYLNPARVRFIWSPVAFRMRKEVSKCVDSERLKFQAWLHRRGTFLIQDRLASSCATMVFLTNNAPMIPFAAV